MMFLTLEPVDNGVVKIIEDDNINAAGERFESKTVYDLDAGGLERTAQLLQDVILDLGLDAGSEEDSQKIEIKLAWGKNYKPKQDELKAKIEQMEKELEKLKASLTK